MPKKKLTGKVTSTKMEKTVVVSLNVVKMHPVYKKSVKKTKKFKARDELGVKLGDKVVIEECVPISKTVTWKVIEKLEKEGK